MIRFKPIIITLLLVVTVFSRSIQVVGYGKVKIPNTTIEIIITPLAMEYNGYDIDKLEILADSLLNGVIDTSLSTEEMTKLFLKTSRIGKVVKLSFGETKKGILGYYRRSDSTIKVSSAIQSKVLAISVVVHELTHSIQHNHQFYTYGRKTVIVNELFADYVAVKLTNSGYRQSIKLLATYLDKTYLPVGVLHSKTIIMNVLYVSVSNRIKDGKWKPSRYKEGL